MIAERIREAGLAPDAPTVRHLVELYDGADRLSAASVAARRRVRHHAAGPLSELVPIENAAMPDRTVIEWDKDDLDALGILKVDCLAWAC